MWNLDERFEDSIEVFGRNSAARIAHRDRDETMVQPSRNVDCRVAVGRADRIRDEIRDHPLDLSPVRGDVWQIGGRVDMQMQPFASACRRSGATASTTKR